DELNAMSKQIHEKLPAAKISFIPRTLYELFFLHFLETNKLDIQKASGELFKNVSFKQLVGTPEQSNTLYLMITEDLKIPDQAAIAVRFPTSSHHFEDLNKEHEVFKMINSKEEIEAFHHILNNYIIDFIKKNNIQLPITKTDALKLVDNPEFWQPVSQQY